jgi:YfiH family protein
MAGIEGDSGGVVERSLASERGLALSSGSSMLLFGIGPPERSAPPEQRAAALLEALKPVLRSLTWCEQVHGTDILSVSAETAAGASCVGPGDGLISTHPGIGLMVWTADCVPLLITGRHAVAAVHVGWRGAAAGIASRAVERCVAEDGGSPAELSAVLGPAVSGARYQVGSEVVDALRSQGIGDESWLMGDRVDLRRFLHRQLAQLGVVDTLSVGGCTASTPELASFRRDGENAGRQWSLVYRSR